ncbi:neutral/alkaline ceramidase [Streptomyces sp. NA04227]|uniref:neutral/alkaline ceramidase n=1 Tax=Streptomyces sp. NA04227 TaxID=2742136 RepID=UPI0015906E60|nr:neutral/alkaline ceramidase [Streptomyces sp. NA04227]QKW10023.1 neutral/alkaline ceramidase [Streptomyces sp. NA04227]
MARNDRSGRSRRTVLKAGAGTGIGLAAGAVAGTVPARAQTRGGAPEAAAGEGGYLVGRGIADATGEIAEVGLMGYGRFDQQAEGLHTRLRARSFVVVDRASGSRVLLCVVDSPMIFESVHQAVLRELQARFGELYTHRNVMLTATHTHAGPGGCSHHVLYNLTTFGFHEKTFQAVVDGIVESAERAHADLAPSQLVLTHTELTDVSANRSRAAFERNKADIKRYFPDAIDPLSTLLRVERDGEAVGAVNWFPVHGTSMSGDNRYVSADNKGCAAHHWEREVAGVDYLADGPPAFVSAFAQTNSGDMSPNTDLQPPTTPADFARTRQSGLRQYEAAAGQLTDRGREMTGPVDARLVYVDLSDVVVRPEFTGDGLSHRTSSPCIGAAMAAGSVEDGPAFPGFAEGENPFWDAVSDSLVYEASPALKEAQAPKGIFVPVGEINKVWPWVQEQVPVQLVRIGRLYLIGIPGEVTIGAGYRLRTAVAEAVGAELEDVLVAGYANSYIHYVTTPEEYDAQHYEGGSTLFGRWQLPALTQTAVELADALREGREVPLGPVAPDLSKGQLALQPGVVLDAPPLLKRFGQVQVQPLETYAAGQRVEVVFVGAHPGNDLHRGGTFLEVQRLADGDWRTVADDGDWSTRFRWQRDGIAASKVTVTWDVPEGTTPGSYRVRYHGEAKPLIGKIESFSGTSAIFRVR